LFRRSTVANPYRDGQGSNIEFGISTRVGFVHSSIWEYIPKISDFKGKNGVFLMWYRGLIIKGLRGIVGY
jgi:hypothetical protein